MGCKKQWVIEEPKKDTSNSFEFEETVTHQLYGTSSSITPHATHHKNRVIYKCVPTFYKRRKVLNDQNFPPQPKYNLYLKASHVCRSKIVKRSVTYPQNKNKKLKKHYFLTEKTKRK